MPHPQQMEFCKWVKRKLPLYFDNTLVLDIGSLDNSGNNRRLFNGFFNVCNYIGIDMVKGPNVDIVGHAHELLPSIRTILKKNVEARYRNRVELPEPDIDVVISCGMLDHDQFFDKSLTAMYNVLRTGGLLLITAGCEGKQSNAPPASQHCNGRYCRHVGNDVFSRILQPYHFKEYYISEDEKNKNFRFYGIKC